MPTRRRFHTKNSPLPSFTLSYSSPIQDFVYPPKRVVVGRSAALRPRLRLCLTPASKNQVEPSSGCRHGGDFKKKLATALGLSFLPVAHPRPRCSIETSRRRTNGSATAPFSSVPNTCKQESGPTQLGVPTWGRFSKQTSPLPVAVHFRVILDDNYSYRPK